MHWTFFTYVCICVSVDVFRGEKLGAERRLTDTLCAQHQNPEISLTSNWTLKEPPVDCMIRFAVVAQLLETLDAASSAAHSAYAGVL